VRGCRNVLATLDKTPQKYTELPQNCEGAVGKAKKVWKRLKWDPDDIRDLRDRVVANIALLNVFHGQVTR
jgi:hypothetical protein